MVVQVTPIAIDNIGWKTYVIFAALNATWVPIIYFVFPETKGLELEDVDSLFALCDDERRGRGRGRDMGHGTSHVVEAVGGREVVYPRGGLGEKEFCGSETA
ncbi:hypothetical protein E4U43_005897 [Claviceps pusilla]|uniref:Major facilitator superfamily (MFS) profile domain-containing protein n=1 Tax=Claviceps pusilla TaxID=123648 RepID=A0A9P7N2E3_9HYPO|nr:hypothetical protein E4U43_005897 [Claviceps pusilla]